MKKALSKKEIKAEVERLNTKAAHATYNEEAQSLIDEIYANREQENKRLKQADFDKAFGNRLN